MAFGVDKHGGLWRVQPQIQSDFPGPMYPIGFRLIQKVESYLEAEDELDKLEDGPDSVADKDENEYAVKATKVAEDTIYISMASPIKQCGYLQQLPLSHHHGVGGMLSTSASVASSSSENGSKLAGMAAAAAHAVHAQLAALTAASLGDDDDDQAPKPSAGHFMF